MNENSDRIAARFAGSVGSFRLEVDFDAPMRGITAIFGPSGCGKTTVLRCVAGLRHLGGRLTVGGTLWQDDSAGVFQKPSQRPVGYVFQEPSLFPHLSVRGNLMYGARRRAGTSRSGELGFDEVVELLGIAGLIERSVSGLSGGERQRVAIGRALLSHPRLLLMDEPLASLDEAAKEEILPYLEVLHANLAVPILYVSHDVREVARLADRMIVLSKGRNLCEGSVEDVLERLDLDLGESRFESGVVLHARVVDHDPRFRMTRLDHFGQQIMIPAAPVQPGNEVRLRIRARDVALATEKPRSISVRNVLSGTIQEIAERSDTAFAEVLVGLGGGRLRARITRDALADLGLTAGAPVYALVKSITIERPAIGGSERSSGGRDAPTQGSGTSDSVRSERR